MRFLFYNNFVELSYMSEYKYGTDYVVNNSIVPFDATTANNRLCASFDGDADRIVFYFMDGNKFCLLDGDRISSLLFKYIIDCIRESDANDPITLSVVHTAYSNGSFTEFLSRAILPDNLSVSIICAATGVKNLHHEALKADIGIYYEANGHGTVLFNNSQLTNKIPKLAQLSRLQNQLVGDSLTNLVCIMTVLTNMSFSYNDWYAMYKNKPSLLTKISVNDRFAFETTFDEKSLIRPVVLQEYLNTLMSKYTDNDLFCFVRPSGTEDILRLYIEGNKLDLNVIANNIETVITAS
jgi:phosphoacetylglucosamine mutase